MIVHQSFPVDEVLPELTVTCGQTKHTLYKLYSLPDLFAEVLVVVVYHKISVMSKVRFSQSFIPSPSLFYVFVPRFISVVVKLLSALGRCHHMYY